MSTNITKVLKTNRFTWGKPIKWHSVGPYDILEYHPWKSENSRIQTGVPSEEISFYGWIDSEDVHESWPTLETCLAGLMGRKYAGANNGGVGYYFCKMIDAPPYNEEVEE